MEQEHLPSPPSTRAKSAEVKATNEEDQTEGDDSFNEPWSPFEASLTRKREQFFSPITPIH